MRPIVICFQRSLYDSETTTEIISLSRRTTFQLLYCDVYNIIKWTVAYYLWVIIIESSEPATFLYYLTLNSLKDHFTYVKSKNNLNWFSKK